MVSPWERWDSHSIFLLLSIPPKHSCPPKAPARIATRPSTGSPQAVTPWGGVCVLPVAAHLGVIEVANLAQVLPCHHAQTDGQALAQQPQDGGPQQHPQQLGGGRGEGGSRGWALGRIWLPGAPSKVIGQPGDTGREKPRRGLVPSPGRGVALRHPWVPSPSARAPPVPFPLPGLGKPACHGLGGRWRWRGYETPGCFLTPGLGGPGLTLNPATAPHCRSDSTLPGSR